MQRVLAIAWLTWKAAFRFRLFLVLAFLLLAAVVGLPLLIKDDGTARGFTQILLTYTLTAISALLGLSTLWLACGTLARDIEDCQIQVVAVKPISRWQIWFGKWLGIVTLNGTLLALSALSVYLLLQWRSTRLPADQQQVLRNEVLVSRGSAKETDNHKKDIEQETERVLKERLGKSPITKVDLPEVRKQIHEQVKSSYELVPPGYMRQWEIDLGLAKNWLKDKPLQLRIKFNTADRSPSGTFLGLWYVGVPQKTRLWQSEPMSLAPDTFHEFQIPPNLFDANGVLTIMFRNENQTALLFSMDEGMEVLFSEGGFGFNFIRGIGIIFCWMILLATLGLAAASFLSFPVAAFLSMGVLVLSFSTSTLANAVTEGTLGGYDAEKGTSGHLPIDNVAIPIFKAVLTTINLAKDFSPIDSLSSGRSISFPQLSLAFARIVLLLGGVLGAIGIVSFTRRELATAQGTQ
jgi:hypothetical protein